MAGLILSAPSALQLHSSIAVALFPRGGGRGNIANVKTASPSPSPSPSTPQSKQSVWITIATLWYKISHPLRYFVSGNIGNVCLYFLERAVRLTLEASLENPPKHVDSISYFTAYLMHILLMHALNAVLVYGLESVNTRQKYFSTLFGTYQAYFLSAFGSTFVNSYLIQLGVNREISFITTLWIFACINYLWIGYVVKKANETAATKLDTLTPKIQSKRRFVSKREQATMAALRGGYCALVHDWIHSGLTIPWEASP